jgi:hypothetical protein
MKRSNLFWGVALIVAGALFILRAAGLLPVDVWDLFFPLGMMFVGAWIILGRYIRPTKAEASTLSIPLEAATSVELDMDYGAGRLTLAASDDPEQLLGGEFVGGVNWSVDRDEDDGQVDVEIRPQSGSFPLAGVSDGLTWNVNLSRSVPFKIDLDSGACDLRLDFSDVQLTELNMDTGASSSNIKLPSEVPFCKVDIDSGAASVVIEVPEGVAALINVDDSFGSINIDTTRFLPVGSKMYQSADYATAERRAELRVQTGAGSITVK